MKVLRWLGLVILAAAIYDGAIFYSRWSSGRDLARAQAASEVQEARRVSALLGNGELKILGFYSSPGVIAPGGHAILCYGVSGAKTLRLEPAVEEVWPAMSHCLQVSPRRDTEYTLTATDEAGHSVSRGLMLKVVR